MGKALFWVTVFIVVIFVTRLLAIHAAKKRRPPPQAPSNQTDAPAGSEDRD
jgi:hypothetical protein